MVENQNIKGEQSKSNEEKELRKIEVYKCTVCPATYWSREYLRKHAATMHSGDDSAKVKEGERVTLDYICKDCGKGFLTLHALVKHSLAKCSEKEVKLFAEAQKLSAKNEDKMELSDDYTCKECGKHILAHNKKCSKKEDNIVSLYKCQYCPSAYETSHGLKTHISETHGTADQEEEAEERQKPEEKKVKKLLYKCNKCQASFPTREECRDHVNRLQHYMVPREAQHKYISKYELRKCMVCPSTFGTFSGLKSHITQSHPTHEGSVVSVSFLLGVRLESVKIAN